MATTHGADALRALQEEACAGRQANVTVENGEVIARGQTGLCAPAKTWREARDLVGADVGQGDSPVHGALQDAGDGHVDCWVVETRVRV